MAPTYVKYLKQPNAANINMENFAGSCIVFSCIPE